MSRTQFGGRFYVHLVFLVTWIVFLSSSSSFPLTEYTEVGIRMPVGHAGRREKVGVWVPRRAGDRGTIATPTELFTHVSDAWDAVVEPHQAGLVDPKAEREWQVASTGPVSSFTKEEAWHHYRANKMGVVDSARFLIAFGVVPSVQTGGSALHIAAAMNDVSTIRSILDDGPETVVVDVDDLKISDDTTPLFFAVSLNALNAAIVLLERGADPNHVAANGATPLHVAASMGHVSMARLLLDHGANPNFLHSFARTSALHFASEMGRSRMIQLLCERGATCDLRKTTGGTALHTAADTNQTESVRALLAAPCHCDANALLNGDTTPLYLASQRGFAEVVRVLVHQGQADLDFVMPRRSRYEVVDTRSPPSSSLNFGYGLKNTEIGNGATPLHAAVENGHYETTDALLRLGAKQRTSMQGVSPLLLSLQYRHPKIALRLLSSSGQTNVDVRLEAQVDEPEPRSGVFPLFEAAGRGYVEVVKRLLDVGADTSLVTRHGMSALEYALHRRQAETARLLSAHGPLRDRSL